MNLRSLSITSIARLSVVPILVLVPSCSGIANLFSPRVDKTAGFVQVDELLNRVEHVHVDCELSGQNITSAMTALLTLVGPEFGGDPALAYEELMTSIAISEKQAKGLRDDFGPMQESAIGVFENWLADLEAFESDTMREHSRQRMVDARERFEAVVSNVGPAMVEYEAFNRVLRDHALYLGNDFNAESVQIIEPELRTLLETSKSLVEQFAASTEACKNYVRKTALRGQAPQKRQSKQI